MKVIFSY